MELPKWTPESKVRAGWKLPLKNRKERKMFKFNPRSHKSYFYKEKVGECISNQKSTISNIGLLVIKGMGCIVLSTIGSLGLIILSEIRGLGLINNQTSMVLYGALVCSHIGDRNFPNVSQIGNRQFQLITLMKLWEEYVDKCKSLEKAENDLQRKSTKNQG